jgi:hypothetical protein
MEPARSDSWKTVAMPQDCKVLSFYRTYTLKDFRSITIGLVPQEMEDKWFIYYEAPWLYLHRSWTGYCIYKVRFEPDDAGVTVAEAIANRDPAQYTQTDDRRDAEILDRMIKSLIERESWGGAD